MSFKAESRGSNNAGRLGAGLTSCAVRYLVITGRALSDKFVLASLLVSKPDLLSELSIWQAMLCQIRQRLVACYQHIGGCSSCKRFHLMV